MDFSKDLRTLFCLHALIISKISSVTKRFFQVKMLCIAADLFLLFVKHQTFLSQRCIHVTFVQNDVISSFDILQHREECYQRGLQRNVY